MEQARRIKQGSRIRGKGMHGLTCCSSCFGEKESPLIPSGYEGEGEGKTSRRMKEGREKENSLPSS